MVDYPPANKLGGAHSRSNLKFHKRRVGRVTTQRWRINKANREKNDLILKSGKTAKQRLADAWENAESEAPWFELRKSKIKGAGNGVFVTRSVSSIPEGTCIPVSGPIMEHKPGIEEGRQREYTFGLPGGQFLWGAMEWR